MRQNAISFLSWNSSAISVGVNMFSPKPAFVWSAGFINVVPELVDDLFSEPFFIPKGVSILTHEVL